jgi:PleD family two-component response regulator
MPKLLKQADEAMYQTRQSGKAGCSFSSEEHGEQ